MIRRFLAGYLLVELAAIVGLIWWIGIGPTLLVLVGTFLAGMLLAGTQLRRQLARLLSGEFGRVVSTGGPAGAVTDSALVALGTVLVALPGPVTSLAGLAMLAPPTRTALRPVATVVVARSFAKRVGFADLGVGAFTAGGSAFGGPGRGDYIDGEVIEDYRETDGVQLPGRALPPAQ